MKILISLMQCLNYISFCIVLFCLFFFTLCQLMSVLFAQMTDWWMSLSSFFRIISGLLYRRREILLHWWWEVSILEVHIGELWLSVVYIVRHYFFCGESASNSISYLQVDWRAHHHIILLTTYDVFLLLNWINTVTWL